MLASRRHGTGPHPVVLLHGFLGAGRNLASLARVLTRRQPDRVLHLPDLPGHGGSLPSARGADFAAMALEVEAFLESLEADAPVDLAGHSFGARVALTCLARSESHEGLVGRVAILDMTPGVLAAPAADRMVQDLLDAPDHFESRQAAEEHFRARSHDPAIVRWLSMNLMRHDDGTFGWRVDRAYLAAVHTATRPVDLWPVVERHHDRVSVLRGARSSLVTPADCQRFERLGIPLHTLENSGHFLHVDAPEETGVWLQRWVSKAR